MFVFMHSCYSQRVSIQIEKLKKKHVGEEQNMWRSPPPTNIKYASGVDVSDNADIASLFRLCP